MNPDPGFYRRRCPATKAIIRSKSKSTNSATAKAISRLPPRVFALCALALRFIARSFGSLTVVLRPNSL